MKPCSKPASTQHYWASIALAALLAACGESTPGGDSVGDSSGAAGASGAGGSAATGGASAAGGSSSARGGGDGLNGPGGANATGGGAASGGVTGSGGTTGTGGGQATGGSVGAGSGGHLGAGGARNTGGQSGAGGASPAGGVNGTGGGTEKGGATGTGGNTGSGGVSGSGGVTGAGGSVHSGVWKFMPLGDSITGDTCYPKLLAQEFTAKGHANFQFVGTVLNNQSCGTAPNVQTEGHGGYLVTFLTTNSPSRTGLGTLNELTTWAAEKPDIVLMHFGTNDVWSSVAPANIMSAYAFVIDKFRSQNPNVVFFVSKIISMNPSTCTTCTAGVATLDAMVTPSWAAANSTSTSPVYIVDQSATINPSTDTVDGVHPNPAGAQKMADVAYTAVDARSYF
jgi:lysophospholipase L1-like esterase